MAKTRAKTKPVEQAAPISPAYFAPSDLGNAAPRVQYLGGEAAFYLYHQPGAFELKDGVVIPRLTKLLRSGGQCNVGTNRVRDPETGNYRHIPDMSYAFAQLNLKNCRVIPHNVDADLGYPSYLMEVPGTGKYCHRLCQLVPGMEPRPPQKGQWVAWIQSLMERGILTPPHSAEVEKERGKAIRLAEQHEKSGETRHAERLRAQIALLDRSLEASDES